MTLHSSRLTALLEDGVQVLKMVGSRTVQALLFDTVCGPLWGLMYHKDEVVHGTGPSS